MLKVAGPLVLRLLRQRDRAARGAGQRGTGDASRRGPATPRPLRRSDSSRSCCRRPQAPAAAAPAGPGNRAAPQCGGNRFGDRRASPPFIFGIDDALLAAAIGPVVQVLPQLLNAANQKRVQLKQANNKLVTDIVSDVNAGCCSSSSLEAQRQPRRQRPGGAGSISASSTQLLQQARSPLGPRPDTAAADRRDQPGDQQSGRDHPGRDQHADSSAAELAFS